MLAVENGNLDLAFFGVLVKGDGHDIARFYSLVPPCVGIHNDVLPPAPVPNRAAPSVAIDRHFDRHWAPPHISRLERQRERRARVPPRLVAVQLRFEFFSN